MLQLAVSGHRQLAVSTIELDRGGVSYTWETLQGIHDAHPDSELFFLMGADSLHDLPHWREPQRICELALPIAVRRAGSAEIDFNPLESIAQPHQIDAMRRCQIEMPLIELSSTDLRQRIAAHQSVRFRLPRAVEKYIETQGLYLAPEETTATSH
jgi:nicotinate-nucleotide adenylyltransferase